MRYALGTDMQETQLPHHLREFRQWLDAADDICLTIDLAVLPAAAAPGVPLPVVEAMVRCVRESGKLRVADIAECNPALDQDRRTARVAARLAYRLL